MRAGPVSRDVVLVGAGHAHVAVLRMFGMRPLDGVRVTLLTREVETPYSGMLPGVVAGAYGRDEAQIDAGKLVRFAGGRLYQDEAVGIDREAGLVLCRSRPPVRYDVLSLDIGSRPNTEAVPGAAEHAIPVKPIDGFLARFEAVVGRVRAGRSRHLLLVGGGAGGVELLLSVVTRLRREAPDAGVLRFTLVSGSAEILPSFSAGFRARFVRLLAERGVAVRCGARVCGVEPGSVLLEGGGRVEADEVLWTTEAAAPAWLAQTGLPLTGGFLAVDRTLRAAAGIFAAGDMIAFGTAGIPRSGVYAVRAGPLLARNIRATLTGAPLRAYRPQSTALAIVGTGTGRAVMTRNGVTAEGEWVWRLKDRIDRRWLARYTDLPTMAEPAATAEAEPGLDPAAAAMRCGGCGAKVGAAVLGRALAGLSPVQRDDVLVGLEAPDDAAVIDTGGALLSVQTVDYFRAMIDDPYLFGRIAAVHAMGDIYAMSGRPTTALAIATIPYGRERVVEADLSDMMRGANESLREAGCALVGGHTSEGAELALGFAVTGQVERGTILRKSGLQAGDALILTKPVGTGALLAADMRGRARWPWVEGMVRHMLQSNAEAAAILAQHGARAATDVTGFGLAGHLLEMLRESDRAARVTLSAIPILAGALEAMAAGIVSSLQESNARFGSAVRRGGAGAASPAEALLFDPQTSGGLLAGVPPERAPACLAALRQGGYAGAAIIGEVCQVGPAEPAIHLR